MHVLKKTKKNIHPCSSASPLFVKPGVAAGGPRGGSQEAKSGRQNREAAGRQQRRDGNRGTDDYSSSSIMFGLLLMLWKFKSLI